MTQPPGRLFLAVGGALTCALASLAILGALTPWAYLAFVLPAAIAPVVLLSGLAVARPVVTLVVGLAIALGWAECANLVTGTSNGPVARSTFVVGAAAVIALVCSATGFAALMVIAPLAVLAFAATYGFQSLAWSLIVCAVAITVLALHGLPASDAVGAARWRTQSRSVIAVLAVTLAASVAVAMAAPDRSLSPVATPLPQATASAEPSLSPTPATVEPSAPAPVAAEPTPATSWFASRVFSAALALLAVLILLALVALGRIVFVQWTWQRIRRQLNRGSPRGRVLGAWRWTLAQLLSLDFDYPAWESPGSASEGGIPGWPQPVNAPLARLAVRASIAAFADARDLDQDGADGAWRDAAECVAAAKAATNRRTLAQRAFRRPPQLASGAFEPVISEARAGM